MHLVQLFLAVTFNSSYFVEWIPNNATATASPGEWPWQGIWRASS